MATTKQLAFSLKDSMSLEEVKTVIQSRKLRLSPKQISAFLGQLSKLGRPMAAWNVLQSFPAICSEGLTVRLCRALCSNHGRCPSMHLRVTIVNKG